MNIPKEIAEIRQDYLSAERIQKRTDFEEEARKAIFDNLDNLTYETFEKFSSFINADFCGGEVCKDRFGNLFSKPNMDIIKEKNDPQKIKQLIVAVLKDDLTSIDGILDGLSVIKYGVTSLLFYLKDSKQFNVFLGSTLNGLKVAFPQLAEEIVYGKPFEKNYAAFNKLCNELKNQYDLMPQEVDLVLTRLRFATNEPTDKSQDNQNVEQRFTGALAKLKETSSETGYAASCFLTYLIDKKFGTPATPTQIVDFFNNYNLHDRTKNIWYNPWMRKPYENENSCIRTVDHFHQPRKYGCWNGREIKTDCNNTSCKYHPLANGVATTCNFQHGVIWRRTNPEANYDWGKDYIDVINNQILKNNKIPLIDLLPVFYKGSNETIEKQIDQFKSEFNLTEIEFNSFFENPKVLLAREMSFFVLRTGSGGYADELEKSYHFREGIPGCNQLRKASQAGKFVYLEKGNFYGCGEIGKITGINEDNVNNYYAEIRNYSPFETPVPLTEVDKQLSKEMGRAGIIQISPEDYKFITSKSSPSKQVTLEKYTVDDFIKEIGFSKNHVEEWIRLLKRKKQVIFQGPPGTGKTYIADRLAKTLISQTTGFKEIVQFHPDYSYEDFIQGYYPQPENDVFQFKLKPGRFLEFCNKIEKESGGAPCVLIIDEINRAKVSRVFGELMFLLEYRDRKIPLAAGGEFFSIPENLFIIGTMNTADRSIALVDHALRRRFAFIRLTPDYDVLKKYLEDKKLPSQKLIETLKQINQAIGDPNYEIGISFFMKDGEKLLELLHSIWKTEIEPYLEEYFYDQPSKVESFCWEQLCKSELREWASHNGDSV